MKIYNQNLYKINQRYKNNDIETEKTDSLFDSFNYNSIKNEKITKCRNIPLNKYNKKNVNHSQDDIYLLNIKMNIDILDNKMNQIKNALSSINSDCVRTNKKFKRRNNSMIIEENNMRYNINDNFNVNEEFNNYFNNKNLYDLDNNNNNFEYDYNYDYYKKKKNKDIYYYKDYCEKKSRKNKNIISNRLLKNNDNHNIFVQPKTNNYIKHNFNSYDFKITQNNFTINNNNKNLNDINYNTNNINNINNIKEYNPFSFGTYDSYFLESLTNDIISKKDNNIYISNEKEEVKNESLNINKNINNISNNYSENNQIIKDKIAYDNNKDKNIDKNKNLELNKNINIQEINLIDDSDNNIKENEEMHKNENIHDLNNINHNDNNDKNNYIQNNNNNTNDNNIQKEKKITKKKSNKLFNKQKSPKVFPINNEKKLNIKNPEKKENKIKVHKIAKNEEQKINLNNSTKDKKNNNNKKENKKINTINNINIINNNNKSKEKNNKNIKLKEKEQEKLIKLKNINIQKNDGDPLTKKRKKLSIHEEENISIEYNQKDEITNIAIYDFFGQQKNFKPRNINVLIEKLKRIKPNSILLNKNDKDNLIILPDENKKLQKSNSSKLITSTKEEILNKYNLKKENNIYKKIEKYKINKSKGICEKFKKNPQSFYTEELCSLVIKSLELEETKDDKDDEEKNKIKVNKIENINKKRNKNEKIENNIIDNYDNGNTGIDMENEVFSSLQKIIEESDEDK